MLEMIDHLGIQFTRKQNRTEFIKDINPANLTI